VVHKVGLRHHLNASIHLNLKMIKPLKEAKRKRKQEGKKK
jgi:hypothetical protein